MYLDVGSHMLVFYGKKTKPRAGLLHDQDVIASKAIANIPTWMGYFARWRVQCVSVSKASEHRLSSMQLNFPLSIAVRPFQPWATSPSALEDNTPQAYLAWNGLARGSGLTAGSPVENACLSHHYSSDEESVSSDNPVSEKSLGRRCGGRGSQSSWSGSDSDGTSTSGGRQKKKDGFSSKIQIPEFGGKKGHPHDVADAFRQWACCITYYCDYYEDSYLMPLVVSSLTGDASDMFNWTCSVSPEGTQDLSKLLQMLREHYCGSFIPREQRNMVKNLRQGAREDATDFMIRVGSSVSNLVKYLKGQITEAEVKSLQYKVSLNGVREEIQHVLDSEITRHGQLTPHQMYEVVKKYETYVACNKHLEGKSASPHVGHQRATSQTSGYKPHFHKTTAFAASVEESQDPVLAEPELSPPEDDDHLGGEPTQEGDEGLYIPSFLEGALGGDCNHQIKMACTMQTQEKHDRKCFICQLGDHLMKDHYKGKNGMGPLQPKGPPQNKSACEMAKVSPPGQATSHGAPPK